MSKNTPTTIYRKGLTLIELLMALAVIMILAAVLISGISGMRGQTSRAGCISNIRSLGAAASLYAVDHNGAYPISAAFDLGINSVQWPGLIDRLSDYVGNDYKVFYCTEFDNDTVLPFANYSYSFQKAKPEGTPNRFQNIGYRWLMTTGSSWKSPELVLPQKTEGDSRRVLSACVDYWAKRRPHGGMVNFLFADGSVDSRSNVDIWRDIGRSTLLFK